MHRVDKNRPTQEWIEHLRRRFPVEKEIDRILTRKMTRRAGPGYSSVSLDTLTAGVELLLKAKLSGPFEVRNPRWMSGGASKVQMAFDLTWSQSGNDKTTTTMVLRMEPAESIVETSRLREFQLIKAFEGVIPVPPVYWVDNAAEFLPYPAMICGFCDGVARPTKGVDGISGIGTNFGPVARPSLGKQFLEHLATIHTRDWKNADLSAFDIPEDGTEAVEWQLNWWERAWEEDVNEDVPLMRLAMAWMRANMPPVDRLSIVHGDYRTGNFLYTEDEIRISAILDWELGHFGDRHEDLAWAIRAAFGHLAEDGKTFLVGGFMPETQFMDMYQSFSGMTIEKKKLDFYKIFNAYKNIQIVLATGYRVARGSKGHQDVLLGWLLGISYPYLDDMRVMLEDLL